MDCMDCHNRPSHVFLPPETAVDQVMAGGNISPKLPWIKKLALDALVARYDEKQNVREEIRQFIEAYYTKNFPEVLKNQKAEVDQAIDTIFAIYDRNVFPSMQVDWTTYPNNIGHRNWPGCFRCHDNHHVSESGKDPHEFVPRLSHCPSTGGALASWEYYARQPGTLASMASKRQTRHDPL